jgi:thiamine biosynthesis lipoprotein
MRSRSSIEIRRCRPLLGTFVEIAALGAKAADLERGIDAAFAVVEKVCRLMSYHDPQSDVSRMNREAFPKSVVVDPWTWQVLRAAQQFALESNGAFNICIAPVLIRWRYLPNLGYHVDRAATWRHIFLRKNCRVFFCRPLIIDLGGIAKGFAVDRAVDALEENGVESAIVNAGGDLRVFGSTSQIVHLRDPSDPGRIVGAVRLRERAMATSGIYFSERNFARHRVSPIIDGRTGRPSCMPISVSVAAPDCMTADALTKIVFTSREKAARLLARHRADALLLERKGAPSWMFNSSCGTRDQTRSN